MTEAVTLAKEKLKKYNIEDLKKLSDEDLRKMSPKELKIIELRLRLYESLKNISEGKVYTLEDLGW